MLKRVLPVLLAGLLVAGLVVAVTGQGSEGGGDGSGEAAAVKRPNVVVLLLDEFPSDTLLDGRGRIDAARFPNFAELARSSTFFRNATSYYDSTPKAIPLILDGKKPYKGQAADISDHPESIYTAFGRRGYRIVDSEEATALCPRRYCPGARTRRPGILANLNRNRPERFAAWLSKMRKGKKSLYVKHALFPHGPWMFLPSGKQTRPTVKDPVPGLASPKGFYDSYVTNHNKARYLLQLGFVDRLLGNMIDRLKRTGIWDSAAVMVVADHGYSWDVGVPDRRRFRNRSIDQVAPVPMFVKAPGQRRGRVNGAWVRTLDALATLSDVTNMGVGYRMDGRSGFGPAAKRRRVIRVPERAFTRTFSISTGKLARQRAAHRRSWERLFGSGLGNAVAYGDPWGGLYRFGPNSSLVGRPVSSLTVGGAGKARAQIANARLTRNVRKGSELVPTQFGGRLTGGRRGVKRNIAIAINGTIQTTGRSFYMQGERLESFAAIVPEAALRNGRNDVRIYEVKGKGASVRLVPLGSN